MINATYYAGPIQYALLADETYRYRLTYRKWHCRHIAGENTIYLKHPDDATQIIGVWNRYAMESGSGWVYSIM